MEKDKLILVFYINVDGINAYDVSEYLSNAARHFQGYDVYESIFIPVHNQETKVDCINPVLLNEEQYKKVEDTVSKLSTAFGDFTKNFVNNKN